MKISNDYEAGINFGSTAALELNLYTHLVFSSWINQIGWDSVIEAVLETLSEDTNQKKN